MLIVKCTDVLDFPTGWVSVVGMSRSAELDVTLRVYTPGACGIYIRPAMLKNAHVFHLKRVKNTLKYKRNKPKLLLMKGEQFWSWWSINDTAEADGVYMIVLVDNLTVRAIMQCCSLLSISSFLNYIYILKIKLSILLWCMYVNIR